MIDQERDGGAGLQFDMLVLLLPLLPQLLVKFDEEERLVLDGREKVILSNEVEYVRTAEPEEERQGFARLAVDHVSREFDVQWSGVCVWT